MYLSGISMWQRWSLHRTRDGPSVGSSLQEAWKWARSYQRALKKNKQQERRLTLLYHISINYLAIVRRTDEINFMFKLKCRGQGNPHTHASHINLGCALCEHFPPIGWGQFLICMLQICVTIHNGRSTMRKEEPVEMAIQPMWRCWFGHTFRKLNPSNGKRFTWNPKARNKEVGQIKQLKDRARKRHGIRPDGLGPTNIVLIYLQIEERESLG